MPQAAHPPFLPALTLFAFAFAPAWAATIDVTAPPYGADPSGAMDARPAIEAAMSAAEEGDELYFPKGSYRLASAWSSDPSANIRLKSGVSLRGEGRDSVTLVTSFDDEYRPLKPAGGSDKFVIRGRGVRDLRVGGLTISSAWKGGYSLDTKRNNKAHGGPDVCVLLQSSASEYSERVVIEELAVEKFLNIGIKVGEGCHEVTLRSCVARSATDVGPGGCGYGFQLSGRADNGLDASPDYANPNLSTLNDNYGNSILSCSNGDRYIRHGALIQYWAHDNLVADCVFEGTRLDSIDLHGEDEYRNEIARNVLRDCAEGAAIGLGNSGGSHVVHDKSGPSNYVHDNAISGCLWGISVQFGTPDTRISRNAISLGPSRGSSGILLGHAPGTVVEGNDITGEGGAELSGIVLARDEAVGHSRAGAPSGCAIRGNRIAIRGGGKAIRIYAQGEGNDISDN